MHRRFSSLALCTGLAAAGLFVAPTALANGKFPEADFFVAAPSSPDQLVVRATFGLLRSLDRGKTWGWVCETGALYLNYEPAVAITENDNVLLSYLDGVGVAPADMCDWQKPAGDFTGVFVADVSIDPSTPSTAYAVSAQSGVNITRVYRSTDNGQTWAQAGVDLPTNFLAKTLDIPAGAADTIYVSGQDTSTGVIVGRFARSTNGGDTWELFDIPQSGVGTTPYIAAIDPNDPAKIYVRLDGAPGRLMVSSDAGEQWNEVFTGTGFLKGFALSPDGQTVVVGGDLDGVNRADTSTFSFEKASDVGVRCMRWTPEGLYVCADETTDGFTIGVSQDKGSSFDVLLHLPCLPGPIDCGGGTTVGQTCPAEWPALATQIGAPGPNCGAGGGGQGGGGQGGEGGSSSSSDASSASTGTGGGDDGSAEDCSCTVPGQNTAAAGGFVALTGLLLAALRRRTRRLP